MPRQRDVPADVQSVALIVIQQKISVIFRRLKIRQPAVDGASALGDLIRVGHVNFAALAIRGERNVSSQPRMSAPSIVSGKKMSELPTLL